MTRLREPLVGRYELLDVLGRGGMGVVYRARDQLLDRIVAVKLLPLGRAEDPEAVARFERESLAAAGLNHRNIVAVFDSGTDGETPFIVMEYLPGRSLAELVRQDGPLPVGDAVEVGAQIAAALAAAHRAGIVHRDIKPANVMRDRHGVVKVLDFGIARISSGTSLTQTATVLGSAPYLAPELARGARADARSDIYALGCVLYELLTGRPPFTAELPVAILHQHGSVVPRRPEELNPQVPPRLSALIMRMLAKDPDRRPQDAQQLVRALPAAAAAAGTEPLPVGVAASAMEPTRVMARGPARGLGDRRALGLLVAGLIAVLAVALLVVLGTSGPASQRSAHRTSADRSHAQTVPAGGAVAASTTTAARTLPVSAVTGPAGHGAPGAAHPHPGGPQPPGKGHARGGPHGAPPGLARGHGEPPGHSHH